MKITGKVVALIVGASLAISIIIDYSIIQHQLPWLHRILAIEVIITHWAGGDITIPRLSLLPLLAIPSIVMVLMFVPYTSLHNRESWRAFGVKLKTIFRTCFWVLVLLIVGELIFLFAKKYLLDAIGQLPKILSVGLKLYSFDFRFLSITFTPAGIIGMLVGMWIWYRTGIKK